MLAIGARIELVKTLNLFSVSERERLADSLSSIAADIKKGAAGQYTLRYTVEYERDNGYE
jgi:hypothetical protein